MLALAAVAGWAATGADADFSPQSVLAGRDDLAADMEAARARFGAEDAVLLVLLKDDRPRFPGLPGEDGAGVLSAEALAWQQQLVAALPDLPHVEAVAGVTTLQTGRMSLANLGEYETVPLVPGGPDGPPTPLEAAWVREQLSDDRAAGLVSADRRTAAVLAVLAPEARSAPKTRQAINAVNARLRADPPPAGLSAEVGGMPALRLAIVDGLERDAEWLFPLSGGLFLLALAVAFRRTIGVVVPLLGVACGLSWAAGLLAAGGTTFGILANVLPVLLTVVGFAAAVHLLARYAEEAAETAPGDDEETAAPLLQHRAARNAAAKRTFVAMAPAVGLTMGTTAIGFGSLLTANSDAVRALAVQAATGLVCLGFSTLAAFAALARRCRPPRPAGRGIAWNPAVPVGGWAVRHPAAALGLGAATVAACGLGALGSAGLPLPAGVGWRGLTVDSRMLETYDEAHPAARVVRRVERDLGGVIAVEALLFTPDAAGNEPGGLLDPAVYADVLSFSAEARELPGTLSVRGYPDLYQRTLAGVLRDPEVLTKAPAGPDAADRLRQAGGLLERAAPGSIDPFLNRNASAGRVVVRVADVGTAATLRLSERIGALLNERFPPDDPAVNPRGIRWRLTGDGYVNAVGMNRFIRDFLWGLTGATGVIFAVIGLLFRSVRAGLIAMIPNLTPLILTLGYMRLRGLDLNAGNAIVFAVGLGVAVDDTIHFLARFREEVAAGRSVTDAVTGALAASGRAIVLTSALILAGLSVLLWSEFVPTRRFAELTCVTLAAALLGDLVLLPAALAAFWRSDQPAAPPSVPTERGVQPA
ncbi:efflux RND transporter permease subunit [Alienimonas californiensis]|uniref:Multidrug resistance protein MdtC n=1 Tax=Alienimonas californiensis TaxID=2527989 RepID=A0A517PAU0_9PLAN|nr:MMPL family transporter [Alienimonas californiensis]QDT16484.1 Multidrug resistance protein MdtC [Alienimonas californiensis]